MVKTKEHENRTGRLQFAGGFLVAAGAVMLILCSTIVVSWFGCRWSSLQWIDMATVKQLVTPRMPCRYC